MVILTSEQPKKTRQISSSKKKTHLFSFTATKVAYLNCNQTGDALHGHCRLTKKKRVFGKSAVRLSTFYLFRSAGNNNMSQTAVKSMSETPKARSLALFTQPSAAPPALAKWLQIANSRQKLD